MPDLVGKRVNIAGNLGVVERVENGLAYVNYDEFETGGLVLESIIAALPEVMARDSFDYRPGDRE